MSGRQVTTTKQQQNNKNKTTKTKHQKQNNKNKITKQKQQLQQNNNATTKQQQIGRSDQQRRHLQRIVCGMEEVMSQLTKAPDELTDKGRYRAARAAKNVV